MPILSLEDLTYNYPDGPTVLHSLNLSIEPGEFVALIGQNGAGKSTLLKQFNGLLKPVKGRVVISGIATTKAKTAKLAQKVGFLFQNPDHQIFLPSVRQEIAFGPKNLKLSPQEIATRVEEAAEAVGLTECLDENPIYLSKGQRQRVAFASILSMKPEILVLDEPTTGQDYREGLEIMEMVRQLNEAGHTIIFVTHDMELVARYASRVVLLQQGRITMDGPTQEVFYTPEKLSDTNLSPPQIVELALRFKGVHAFDKVLTVEDVLERMVTNGGGEEDVRCG
ncbi:MAG TPA: ABC transporter ATP-binding protein [Bacillota bacterium]|nr:ABC transporter ATP-binding protein [Bacillota bacterium]